MECYTPMDFNITSAVKYGSGNEIFIQGGGRAVAVCAVGYKNGLSDGYPDDFRAKIASYALTADYHATIKGMLGDLFGRLRAAEPALAGRARLSKSPSSLRFLNPFRMAFSVKEDIHRRRAGLR